MNAKCAGFALPRGPRHAGYATSDHTARGNHFDAARIDGVDDSSRKLITDTCRFGRNILVHAHANYLIGVDVVVDSCGCYGRDDLTNQCTSPQGWAAPGLGQSWNDGRSNKHKQDKSAC